MLGKKINYEVLGSGTPILFLHGWGGNNESLKNLALSYSDNYACHLIDLPGFGSSDKPENDWGVDQYADVIRRYILELNLSPAICMAHSFGGTVALKLACTDSDLFRKLVLFAPSFHRPNAAASKRYDIGFLKKGLLFPIRKLLYKILYPNSDAVRFKHLEGVFRSIVNTDLRDDVKDIKCESLIMWGSDDIYVPLNDAYILNESIKESSLKIFDGVGHELPVYYPNLVVNDINSFLKA